MNKLILIAGLGVLGLGALLHIVGLATTGWIVHDGFDLGLFRLCSDIVTGTTVCADLPDRSPYNKDALLATRAFVIIGMLLAGGAGVLALLYLVLILLSKETRPFIPVGVVALAFASFGSIILAVIIFGAGFYSKENFDDADADLGYSFGLSIVGAILIAVGGTIFFVGK